MGAARLVVVVSALGAPLLHAALLTDTRSPWPTIGALVLGLVAWKRQTLWLAGLLGVGPIWHALAGAAAGDFDLQLVMPWLAALAATLARPPVAAWRARGPWLFGTAAWALSVALAWPVAAARELDFTTAAIGAATANGVLSPSPSESAALIALAAEGQLVALLLFDWFWGARQADRRQVWLGVMPGVAAACAVALWQSTVNPAFLSRAPWIALDRAAGTFYDANALGALAALLGPVLAGQLGPSSSAGRAAWRVGWLAVSLAAVMASGSRTALAAWAVASVVMLLASRRAFGWRRVGAAGVAVVIAGTIGLRLWPPDPSSQGNPLTRLTETIRAAAAGGLLAGLERVLWSRDGYGTISMAVIAEHPWVGVGPGAFAIVAPDYAVEVIGALLPPDNAQNWWRHQWAELGLLGAAGAVACSLLAALAVIGSWRRSTDPEVLARSTPLMALGLMSFVSPPTQHPILQVLIALVVANGVIQTHSGADSAPSSRPVATWNGWLIWAAASTCAAGLAIHGWTDFRPPYRAARFHFVYSYGLSSPTQTPLGEGRWAGRHAVGVIPPAGRTFVVRLALPHDDLAAAPVRVHVSDGSRLVCSLDVSDHSPVECRLPVSEGTWPIVRLDISRHWIRGIRRASRGAGLRALRALSREPTDRAALQTVRVLQLADTFQRPRWRRR